jgi:histidine decarboxylase
MELEESLKKNLQQFLGYPCNIAYDYSNVTKMFNTHINNVGCPFSSSTYKVNTKDVEITVLEYFAKLWGLDPAKVWGYISNGGTEANLQGLYVARESLDANAIFYTSEDSHYSIFKIAKILKLNLCVVRSQENGEIDYNDFDLKVGINKYAPVIINVNLGTTMKGAIDNPREIFRILQKHHKENEYYMHADGALMGFVLPFLEKDTFFKKHIHSISISGHKFLGIPFPCGVFLMERRFLKHVQNNIEYIGSKDCMISGSRNGHSPLFFKHILDTKTLDDFKADITNCIELAEYLVSNLPGSWRNQNSITVVFPRPSIEIIEKWQLATSGDISHVVVMPHVTKEKLDAFIAENLSSSLI